MGRAAGAWNGAAVLSHKSPGLAQRSQAGRLRHEAGRPRYAAGIPRRFSMCTIFGSLPRNSRYSRT
jgi:hypothetical protein